MKSFLNIMFWSILSTIGTSSCKSKASEPSIPPIQNVWTVLEVKENNVVVYARGASNNIKPSYERFRLELRAGSVLSMTDLDRVTSTGTWAISPDQKALTLSNLNPVPTGTGGSIIFTVEELNSSMLSIHRITSSPKTGGTQNFYRLTNK